MRFRTEYNAVKSGMILNPARPVVLTGSCFADNIGSRMRQSLWNACNPMGTLYNPLSIARALECVLDEDGEEVLRRSLFEADGIWRSWLFDSKMSSERCGDILSAFRRMKVVMADMLSKAQVLFVTFGTAWCYFLTDNPGYVVANCHKRPSSMFVRRRITIDGITRVWKDLIARLTSHYPGIRIVFTVSPVRHLKDGFEGNARSKALLLLAIEELCAEMDVCGYFPAYEIVNDDLRDYRFYASDLVHPSDEGVDYIWEKFCDMYLDEAGLRLLKEGESIRRGLEHRPLPNATKGAAPLAEAREAARLESLRLRYSGLLEKYPDMLILPLR